MTLFQKIDLDFGQADREVAELREFLDKHPSFKENEFTSELKKRPHAASLIGCLIAELGRPDLYKFELPLLGTFRPDLVVGSSQTRRFVFVEFEGGEPDSLFSGGTAQMRNWSTQFGHGFGQLVDWAWTINTANSLTILQNAFGC